MKKSVMRSILAVAVGLTCLWGIVGYERGGAEGGVTNDLCAPGIGSGSIHSNTGLEVSKMLNESNGEYVNFYVENNGSNPVVATINGQSERTFHAGEKGCIYLEVTQGLFGLDREYQFKAVPGTNGGSINIRYEITQDAYCCSEDTRGAKS